MASEAATTRGEEQVTSMEKEEEEEEEPGTPSGPPLGADIPLEVVDLTGPRLTSPGGLVDLTQSEILADKITRLIEIEDDEMEKIENGVGGGDVAREEDTQQQQPKEEESEEKEKKSKTTEEDDVKESQRNANNGDKIKARIQKTEGKKLSQATANQEVGLLLVVVF
jgi:hypothetical protein